MPYTIGSSKVIVYFHANAEDIVLANELLDYMRVILRVNIIAVEYPGYGLYTDDFQKRQSHQAMRVHHKVSSYQHTQSSQTHHNPQIPMFTGKTPRFGEKGDSRQLLIRQPSSNSKS